MTAQAETAETDQDSTGQGQAAAVYGVHEDLPLGTVLKNLRGERSLRDVQRDTGVANSYLCNVERGSQQPGLKTLSRMAKYYQVSVADIIRQAELMRDHQLDPQETRDANIERSFRFIMDDPRLRLWEDPETPLSVDAKRHMVRMYELLTGKLLIN